MPLNLRWRRLCYAILRVLPLLCLTQLIYAGQVTLSWKDNSENEDGFEVERAFEGESFDQIAIVTEDKTTYVDPNCQDNQTYIYRVRAFNGFGKSGYTNTVIAFTSPTTDPSPPTIPSGLTAKLQSDSPEQPTPKAPVAKE